MGWVDDVVGSHGAQSPHVEESVLLVFIAERLPTYEIVPLLPFSRFEKAKTTFSGCLKYVS